MQAARHGQLNILGYLKSCGADVNAVDEVLFDASL